MGANSICIKDMAGLLVPYEAERLVKALKENVSLPIELHTHYTSGVASMSSLKAVEAGCDILDTAISPLALGTSQPATEVMVETFKGTPYDTGLNQDLLAEINEYFSKIREEAMASGLLNPKVLGVNINTLRYQVPGGMLSNMISQLKEQNAEDKYEELDLKKALNRLEPENRTVIILRYFEDMKIEDIALVVDENVNTVKTRLYRSLKKLRIQLDDTAAL